MKRKDHSEGNAGAENEQESLENTRSRNTSKIEPGSAVSKLDGKNENYQINIVDSADSLSRLCSHIDSNKLACFDFEFIPERNYYPVLCLIQVCVEKSVYLVDPLSFEQDSNKSSNPTRRDENGRGLRFLQPLWERIADPSVKCIFHAGSQDLELAYKLSGLVPANIFDTQIAAGFAGLGYSAGYRRLLDEVLGVDIAKTESFSDWQIRPLTDSQIDYAVNDVIYLEPLEKKLTARLEELARYHWVKEECQVYEQIETYERNRERDFMRIKGANTLSPRGLAILRELYRWRDEKAKKLDKPSRFLLTDAILLELSRRKIDSMEALMKMRGIRPEQIKGNGQAIIEAIQKALALSHNQCPTWPSSKPPQKSELLAGDFLYLMLKCRALEIGLAPEHLANRDELQGIVRCLKEGKLERDMSDDYDFKLLKSWRYEHAGKTILDLLRGKPLEVKIDLDESGEMHLLHNNSD